MKVLSVFSSETVLDIADCMPHIGQEDHPVCLKALILLSKSSLLFSKIIKKIKI